MTFWPIFVDADDDTSHVVCDVDLNGDGDRFITMVCGLYRKNPRDNSVLSFRVEGNIPGRLCNACRMALKR